VLTILNAGARANFQREFSKGVQHMTSKTFFYQFLVTTTVVAAAFSTQAFAADVTIMDLPAVSAFNGKIEAGGGFADLKGIHSTGLFYGGAALSMPLGDKFGLQADFTVDHSMHNTSVGGAAHLFTRNPGSYLLGAYGGFADVGSANLAFIGGEGELYMGNVSAEMLGGYMNVKPDGKNHQDKAFALVDLGYYATDNFRLTLGASSVAGFESGHAGFEYMLDSTPFSINGDARVGESGFASASIGGTFYFGGSEANKSLIRRHREDDPRIRFHDIFGGGGLAAFIKKKNGNPPVCAEQAIQGKLAAAAVDPCGPTPQCYDPEAPGYYFDPECPV
jgi:hypothetical protein